MRIGKGKLVYIIVMLIWTVQTIRFFLIDGFNNDETSGTFAFFSVLYLLILSILIVAYSVLWMIKNWNTPLIKKK